MKLGKKDNIYYKFPCNHKYDEFNKGYYHSEPLYCMMCNESGGMLIISLMVKPNILQRLLARIIGLKWRDGEFRPEFHDKGRSVL